MMDIRPASMEVSLAARLKKWSTDSRKEGRGADKSRGEVTDGAGCADHTDGVMENVRALLTVEVTDEAYTTPRRVPSVCAMVRLKRLYRPGAWRMIRKDIRG